MKHRIITCILAFILTVGLLPCPSADAVNDFPFKDVASNAWYYTAVDSAYQTGIIAGTSATEFAPDHNITLAQAVTFAARMHQYTQTGAVTLQNDPDVWYRSYVEYCEQYGMIDPKEYEDRWNSYATRAEMVKIFHACLPEDSFAPINTIENNAIPDVRDNDHAASAIYDFYRAGILTGSNAAGMFMPDTNIKRSEVSAIISRMLYPEQRKSFTLAAQKPSVPALTANLNAENVLQVLKAYDPDGAFILNYSLNNGNNFLDWWSSDRLCDGINMAVHEECHDFTWREAKHHYNAQAVYIGDGNHILVKHTDVFNSLEMASTIPQQLRTDRYDLYVGSPYDGGNLSSQVEGVYGLLNEYTAYYWGTQSALALYDYYMDQNATAEQWMDYIFDVTGTWGAYTEFRYFILQYMIYARDYYPAVYNGILSNQDFIEAFTIIDNNHLRMKKDIWDTFDTLAKHLNSNGVQAIWSGTGFTINGSGYSMMMETYGPFLEEMEKAAYIEMAQIMKA